MTKAKTNLILQEATEIRQFMEKNKRIPLTCTISNVQFSIYSTAYLMALALQDTFKKTEYTLHSVVRYNTNTHSDTINEKVKVEDYKVMVDHFIRYCQEKNRVPSYITTSKSKTEVSFELFVYCLSKILDYYRNNKRLPNYCEFKRTDLQLKKSSKANTNKSTSSSTSTAKKTTTSTATAKAAVKKITKYVQTNLLENIGCKGRGQCTPYYCSCNALQQMFYRLTGILVPEKTIAAWAGVTTSGVGHAGIETAVAKFNKTYKKNLKITWKNFSDLGKNTNERFLALGKLISKANTAVFFHLLYRMLYGHYEPIKSIDTSTHMLEILNSLGTKNSEGSYQGYVENRTYTTQQSYISAMNQKSVCIITA